MVSSFFIKRELQTIWLNGLTDEVLDLHVSCVCRARWRLWWSLEEIPSQRVRSRSESPPRWIWAKSTWTTWMEVRNLPLHPCSFLYNCKETCEQHLKCNNSHKTKSKLLPEKVNSIYWGLPWNHFHFIVKLMNVFRGGGQSGAAVYGGHQGSRRSRSPGGGSGECQWMLYLFLIFILGFLSACSKDQFVFDFVRLCKSIIWIEINMCACLFVAES